MNNKNITIFDVANFFLKIVDRDSGSTMTPLKLQKILYYSQGYFLARKNRPLFDDDFQAWVHGPANPDIYERFKEYGYDSIGEPSEDVVDFDRETLDFLTNIWNVFGIYDGKYLEELTHSEAPWINARYGYEPGQRCDVVISKESMRNFFSSEPYSNV